MISIAEVVSYLQFSRSLLLKSIEGLSQRELTETPIYNGWTIKDVLAHIVGWDRRTVNTLSFIAADRAGEVPGIDVETFNRQSVAVCADKTVAEVLAEAEELHRHIIDMITHMDYKEIDRRHDRNGRVITIRSYVIEIMAEHERAHAAEIELWREQLEKSIDPAELVKNLQHERRHFMDLLDQFSLEAHLSNKAAVGQWSVSDVVGHVADWEQRMLKAARHIHDPSLPKAPPVSETSLDSLDWNDIMAARRQGKTWAENYQDLRDSQAAVDVFISRLTPGDWRLRGPYPWPTDHGTLAELVVHITEHYATHTPAIEQWAYRTHGRISK